MDQDQIIAIACISIFPLCGICCIGAFLYENFCKKARNIIEENKIEESNYKVIEL